MQRFTFHVPTISCIACVNAISNSIQIPLRLESNGKVATILKRRVKLSDYSLTIMVEGDDLAAEDVLALLNEHLGDIGHECTNQSSYVSPWLLGALGTLAGVGMLLLSWLSLPWVTLVVLGLLSLGFTLSLGVHFYKKAFKRWMDAGELGMDALFTISTISAVAVSFLALFIPGLPMLFEVGLLIFGFRYLGIAIEAALDERLGVSHGFEDRLPTYVTVIRDDGSVEQLGLGRVQIGDIILVQPGEVIPLDGVCVDDEEHTIEDTIETGSLIPKQIRRDAVLLSGMVLSESSTRMRLRVAKTMTESNLACLDRQVDLAYSRRTQRYGQQYWLTAFVVGIIVLSIASVIGVGLLFSVNMAIRCALSVLVSACPCTLGLVMSLSLKMGIQMASYLGLMFRSADAIQAADGINKVVCDLNGTLTAGRPVVAHYSMRLPGPFTRDKDFLSFCAFLEEQANSDHVVARAIQQHARNERAVLQDNYTIQEQDNRHHSGIRSKVAGQWYTLGDQTMMHAYEIDYTCVRLPRLDPLDTVIYLARDREVVGYLVIRDSLREDAKAVIQALTDQGKEVYLCTGAGRDVAERYSEYLGIPPARRRWACSPDDKVRYLRQLKQEGHQGGEAHITMVWDGLNDVSAANDSSCDFNVVVGPQDAVGLAHASASIRGEGLTPLVHGFQVARKTANNMQQNLLFSLTYNLLVMSVASGLLLSLGVSLPAGLGVALMVLQTCIILMNVYRLAADNTIAPLANERHVEESYETMMGSEFCYTPDSLVRRVDSAPILSAPHSVTPGEGSLFNARERSRSVIDMAPFATRATP